MITPAATVRALPRTPLVAAPASVARNPIALAGLALCVLAFWMVQHAYEGLVHDSILYAFSALARLHPESLGHDVYLSVGDQDRFTIFSPIAAVMIRLVGLEHAAALLTLLAQIAFFGCAWLLARRLLPARLALLSLALLVMLPTIYGDEHIFSYAEPFMTPRVPSEALVLAALACALARRHISTVLLMLAAALLHPIMAAAGIVMLFAIEVGGPRPKLALGLALGTFALLVALSWTVPFGPVARFDHGWFHLIYSRAEYLFPSRWPLIDWAHNSVPIAVLAVGWITAEQPLTRTYCAAALATGLGGVVASLAGSDLLHVVLVSQVQPWRWLWLSNSLAVLLMPVIVSNCWQRGNATRAAAVLLAAAWVCIDEPYAPLIGGTAILLAAGAGRIADARLTRVVLAGAWVALILGCCVLANFVLGVSKDLATIAPDRTVFTSPYLLELRRWKIWQAGGILPACIFLGAWWLTTRRRDRGSALAVLFLGVALCAAFAQFSWNSWTRIDYPAPVHAQFASWKRVIPPSAQVLWFDAAFPTWFLLDRPSYWSRTQMAASVFSEEMARRLALREWVLTSQRPSGDRRHDLTELCRRNPALDFLVARSDMGHTPFPPIDVRGTGGTSDRIWLYRCADYRG